MPSSVGQTGEVWRCSVNVRLCTLCSFLQLYLRRSRGWTTIRLYEIWGYQDNDFEYYLLLECDAVYLWFYLTTLSLFQNMSCRMRE